jgi:hypothetical protein
MEKVQFDFAQILFPLLVTHLPENIGMIFLCVDVVVVICERRNLYPLPPLINLESNVFQRSYISLAFRL